MSDLQMSLLENAYDFLEEAIDRLSEHHELTKHLKYAILNLSSAIELLLKQRLFEEHWSLVFADVSKANKTGLQSGNFKSLAFDDAMKRLQDICQIDLSNHEDVLRKLKHKRNEIEHYHVVIDKSEAISLGAKAWSFVMDFVANHLENTSSPDTNKQFNAIRQKIAKVTEIVQSQSKVIENQIQYLIIEDILVVDCPTCLQRTLPLTGGDAECLFCKRRFKEISFPEEWLGVFSDYHSWNFFDRAIGPILEQCPDCDSQTLYYFAGDNTLTGTDFGCFACGSHWKQYELAECTACGHLYQESGDDIGMCQDCIAVRWNNY